MGQDNLLKFTYHGPALPIAQLLKNEHLKEFSVKAIRRAIDQKAVMLNQKIVFKAGELVLPKSLIIVDLNRLKAEEKIEIIAEDEALCIIDKPAFVTSSNEEIKRRLKKDLQLCHRIDKETTGLLVLAKNPSALKKMEEYFANHVVKKRYLALVKSNKILKEKFSVNSPIAVKKKDDHQVIMQIHESGKTAETHFKIAKENHPYYLLECFPKTGRTHQIRVHLSAIGAPILGDLVYGKTIAKAGRFMLHAESIHFPHPITSEITTYSASIPSDFKTEIERYFTQ